MPGFFQESTLSRPYVCIYSLRSELDARQQRGLAQVTMIDGGRKNKSKQVRTSVSERAASLLERVGAVVSKQ
jgi:hypothetical protein